MDHAYDEHDKSNVTSACSRVPETSITMTMPSSKRVRQRPSSWSKNSSGERVRCHLPTRRLGTILMVLLVMFHTEACSFSWTDQHHHTNRHQHHRSGRNDHQLPLVEYSSRLRVSSAASTTSDSFPTSGSSSKSNNKYSYSDAFNNDHGGLSKFHRSILTRNADRQRFVTGKYPLTVQITENPTRKWLHQMGRRGESAPAVTELLVNGTAPARSLASFGRFQWLDEEERTELHSVHNMVCIELLAEIHTERPGYLHILAANGAGSSATTYRHQQQQQVESSRSLLTASTGAGWNGWGRSAPFLADQLKDLEDLEEQEKSHGDRLWVTGFSLAGRQGLVKSVDATVTGSVLSSINQRTGQAMLWPNEVHPVPANMLQTVGVAATARTRTSTSTLAGTGVSSLEHADDGIKLSPATPSHTGSKQEYQDALLVCDGFLVPGKDRGGIYVVKNPGNPQTEWTVSLTAAAGSNDRWFYHRAAWVDLTGDGRQSILTARAQISTSLRNGSSHGHVSDSNAGVTSGITKSGELVWLEMPKPQSIDSGTGTPLESDGTVFDPFSARHIPWKTHVLQSGPDVMFSVADLDTEDDTIEVISSQFFGEKVAVHSIQRGPKPRISFERIIDNRCGSAFGSILADLDGCADSSRQQHRRVIDSGSTVGSIGIGDAFSHVLVTSHECSYASAEETDSVENEFELKDKAGAGAPDGGSLFAYRVPEGKSAWKTEPWIRSTVATGFKVNSQLGNMINPGAPGFVYTFHAKKEDIGSNKQPMIAVAGDCAESAYIFRPEIMSRGAKTETVVDTSTRYKLMMEIKCGATVGSIGIGYDDFVAEEESGYAKLYIPCYEKDRVLVFGLGSGEIDEDDGGW